MPKAPPKIPGTNRISPSGVMHSRRQVRREAGRAAQKGYKQSIEAGVRKTSPAARAAKETSPAAKKAVFNLSRKVKAGRQEYLRTGSNPSPVKTNPPNMDRARKKLKEKRARANKTRVKLRHINPGTKGKTEFKFEASRGGKSVSGLMDYYPKEKSLRVESAFPTKSIDPKTGHVRSLHALSMETDPKGKAVWRGKALDAKLLTGALKTIKKRFPKAEELTGTRTTGQRYQAGKPVHSFPLKKLGTKALGPIGFVGEFNEFRRKMEAAKKKRKRAQQGFLPGGST